MPDSNTLNGSAAGIKLNEIKSMVGLCAGDDGVLGRVGCVTGAPANHGFPETLIYAVWALTMIPPALYGLRRVGWRLQRDARSVCYGAAIGLLGAGGQMLLFMRCGPDPPT